MTGSGISLGCFSCGEIGIPGFRTDGRLRVYELIMSLGGGGGGRVMLFSRYLNGHESQVTLSTVPKRLMKKDLPCTLRFRGEILLGPKSLEL